MTAIVIHMSGYDPHPPGSGVGNKTLVHRPGG